MAVDLGVASTLTLSRHLLSYMYSDPSIRVSVQTCTGYRKGW